MSRCVTSSTQTSVKPLVLERKLGLAEAAGLSLSIVAPTMAMAFNVSLVVRAAGRAAPLAFAIGTLALGIVALSFVSFSKRVAHAGSAYAYIGQTFGWRWGFVAGWTLLLTYLAYAAGVSALIGNFLQAATQNSGVQLQGLWLAFSLTGLLLASYCSYHDVKLASRLMLLLEGISVFAILFLCVAILAKVRASQGLSMAPFVPAADFKAWSGIGYALVFCVLSFAGFEGAATLSEETRNPRRSRCRKHSSASSTMSRPNSHSRILTQTLMAFPGTGHGKQSAPPHFGEDHCSEGLRTSKTNRFPACLPCLSTGRFTSDGWPRRELIGDWVLPSL